MRLADKIAIVTGGGIGIGRAISLAFAAEGAVVVIAANNLPDMEKVTEEIKSGGGRAIAIDTDITREEQVQSMVARALSEYGQIDLLVNNSGIAGPTAGVIDVKLDEWNEVLAVNLTGTMLCAREVIRGMIARRSGNIINISSGAGLKGFPLRSPYCVSKWGVIGFTQTLAMEVGEYNIRVNCIAPGSTEGARIDRVHRAQAEAMGITYQEVRDSAAANTMLGRLVTAAEVADGAVFLASDESSAITGQCLPITTGLRGP